MYIIYSKNINLLTDKLFVKYPLKSKKKQNTQKYVVWLI